MTVKVNQGAAKQIKEDKNKKKWVPCEESVDIEVVKRVMGLEEGKVYSFLEKVVKDLTQTQLYSHQTT